MDTSVDSGTDSSTDSGVDSGTDAGCTPTGAETCDGMDDDCNGLVDDGLPCPGAVVISEMTTGSSTSGTDGVV